MAEELLMEKLEPEVDSDGYEVDDPYAEGAKLADRKLKAAEELKNSTGVKIAKMAKTIIENKDTVTYYEKIGKAVLVLLALTYMTLSSEDLKNSKDATSLAPLKSVFQGTLVWK